MTQTLAPDLARLAASLDHTADLAHWFDELQACLEARMPVGGEPAADEERVLKAIFETQLLAVETVCDVLEPAWNRAVGQNARSAFELLARLVRANERGASLEVLGALQDELAEIVEEVGDLTDPDADCFLLLIDATSDEAAFAHDSIVDALRTVLTLVVPSRVRGSLVRSLGAWLLDPARAPHDLTAFSDEEREAEEAEYQRTVAGEQQTREALRCPFA